MTEKIHILVVSRDPELKRTVVDELEGELRHVVVSEGMHAALGMLRRGGADLLVVDSASDAEASELVVHLIELVFGYSLLRFKLDAGEALEFPGELLALII